jgi:hypothetical protein
MADLLPNAYLLGLIGLLAIAAVVVARQIFKVRGDEVILSRLGGTTKADGSLQDAANLYELATVQLRKRLDLYASLRPVRSVPGVKTRYDDVDLIVDIVSHGKWVQLQEELRSRGFRESPEDDVICRMRLGDLKVDFMPDDEGILGFSNRWYSLGLESAVDHTLTDDIIVRVLTAPLFLATKLEALRGRGIDDLLMSRDLEDILLLLAICVRDSTPIHLGNFCYSEIA